MLQRIFCTWIFYALYVSFLKTKTHKVVCNFCKPGNLWSSCRGETQLKKSWAIRKKRNSNPHLLIWRLEEFSKDLNSICLIDTLVKVSSLSFLVSSDHSCSRVSLFPFTLIIHLLSLINYFLSGDWLGKCSSSLLFFIQSNFYSNSVSIKNLDF